MTVSAPVGADAGGTGALETAVGAALDQTRSFRLRVVAPVLLGLVMLFDTWDSAVIAYVAPSLVGEWHLSPAITGLLMSAGFAGQFVGALALGTLAERFGRMPVFLVAMTLVSICAILCALAPDYRTLMVVRFGQGIMIGGALPVVITYINELAPSQARGRYFAVFQFFNMSGSLAASLSSVWIIPSLGWRAMFALGAMPALLLPLVVALLPESPRWLARAGRLSQLSRAMARLGARPIDHAEGRGRDAGAAASPTRLAALFAPELRGRTIVVLLLWFLVPMVSSGLTTWSASLYHTAYRIPIKTALSYSATAVFLFIALMPLVGFVSDRVGRRRLGIGFTAATMIALLAIPVLPGVAVSAIVPLVILAQVTASTVTLILWSYSAEIFPTRVRAMGLGLGSAFARGASMITPAIVGGILGLTHSVTPIFILFGACSLGGLLLWIFRTKETSRTALEAL